LRKRYVALAGLLGVAAAVLPAIASSETPAIEAVNAGLYSHYWSPSQASVAAGGVVTLRNQSATAHGVEWVGGPAKPECTSGVPVGTSPTASGTNWSGTCTFAQAGTYTFYCTVHGPEMTGTITVSAAGVTTNTNPNPPSPTTPTTPTSPGTPAAPTAPGPSGPPFAGPLALRFAARGAALHGALAVTRAGAGGRLEVDVLATLPGSHRRVPVGRLVRGRLAAGRTVFVVRLDAAARRALTRTHGLRLRVRLMLTPTHGRPKTVTRTVQAHV
jgi:plastocyanin